MKTKLLVALFVLIPTVTFAEKWTGPTSPTDPMWGMSGSSIMVEALRQQRQQDPNDITNPNYLWNSSKDKQIQELQNEIDELKSKQRSW